MSSSGSSSPAASDSGDEVAAAAAVTWTWWAASWPPRPLLPSTAGMAVVNGRPPASWPVTCPPGPMITARTIPAATSAVNRL